MALYDQGSFDVQRSYRKGEYYRSSTGRIATAPKIGTELYEWYKGLPAGSRKTRSLFYAKVSDLYADYCSECRPNGEKPEPCSGANRYHRRKWLGEWGKRYRVSWRIVNRKYTISRDQAKDSLSRFWRDCVRLRANLSEKLLFINWDETLLAEDILTDERTAVSTGSVHVGVKANHYASREISYMPNWAARVTIHVSSAPVLRGLRMGDGGWGRAGPIGGGVGRVV